VSISVVLALTNKVASAHRVKVKNPNAPATTRIIER